MRIDLLFFDAGGGHRSAAQALCLAIEKQGRPWDVRMVNLQEALDPIDIFRKITGVRLQDLYNLLLKKGWTLGSAQLMRMMQVVIRLYRRKQVKLLERHWRASNPDVVVSLVPHFNRAIAESVGKALPSAPFVTIITDIADYPPHLWIEPESKYVICGSERAVQQAQAMGHPRERVFLTSGMIIHPRFYEPLHVDRRAERQRLGLDPDLKTGLVMFGGQGSGVMMDIARRLDRSGLDIQLIFVCGRNEKLARKLRGWQGKLRRYVEGFTTEMPYYMHLSDFFIGKPGPGSISEALAMKLPVVVECNAWTLPQERYNADWVLEQHVGFVLPSFRDIETAVRNLIEPANLEGFRARAAAMNNQAVLEIPGILAAIHGRHGLGR